MIKNARIGCVIEDYDDGGWVSRLDYTDEASLRKFINATFEGCDDVEEFCFEVHGEKHYKVLSMEENVEISWVEA